MQLNLKMFLFFYFNFVKGNNLNDPASLEDETLGKRGLLLKERNASRDKELNL